MTPQAPESATSGRTVDADYSPPSSRWERLKLVWAPLVALVILVPGCFGVSSNPFRLGNLPAGNIVRTHAKPSAWGYYRNFDPAAHTLTVTPPEDINQVRTQHVLVASVCDKNGNGRRNRRVEWHVEGVGHLVEVDESGLFPGRGYLVDNKYAVSYTNYKPHTLSRGNDDPRDDVELRPGQTFCVVTSAEEGETYITCHAPGVYDWQKHKVFAVKYWVDAQVCLPPSAVNLAGQPHQLVTRVIRATDGRPRSGLIVRYRVLDDPAAVLDPGGGAQVDVLTDPNGNGVAVLRQLQPAAGANRVSIEVIRPADKPGGKELPIGAGMMTKTWVTPQVAIQKLAPPAAVVGQPIPFQILVTNTGTLASRGVTIRDTLAPGLQLVGANPPAAQQGPNLLWSIPLLQPNQTVSVQFSCSASAPGELRNCAEALMVEGASGQACSVTQIVSGALAVSKSGPASAIVGQPVQFTITVANQGNGPALNVVLTDAFDAGFASPAGPAPLQMPVGNLAPGESRAVPITLIPQIAGSLCNEVVATAEGGLQAADRFCVEVTQPQLSIVKNGPRFAFTGAPVEFEITVQNTGAIPATNVMVRDLFPPQFRVQQGSDGAAVQGNMVIWNLGTLAPGQQRSIRASAVAVATGEQVCNSATVTADGVSQQSQPWCLEIRGIPAFLTELIDRFDPVPVGSETTYTIRIVNQGSMAARGVTLACRIPAGMEFVDAEGLMPFRAAGNTITFEPMDNFEPGRQLLYQVQVRAVRPGDYRFEASISAEELKTPVLLQESTRVYDPATGQINGAGLSPSSDLLPAGQSEVEKNDAAAGGDAAEHRHDPDRPGSPPAEDSPSLMLPPIPDYGRPHAEEPASSPKAPVKQA